MVVRGAGSATVAIAELVSSGAGVLAVCADASRRAALAERRHRAGPLQRRRRPVACQRCGAEAVDGWPRAAAAAWPDRLRGARAPAASLAAHFEHVVLVDPPPAATRGETGARRAARPPAARAARLPAPALDRGRAARSRSRCWRSSAPRGTTVAAAFRALREAGEASGEELRAALAGGGPHPLCRRDRGPLLPRSRELGLVAGEPSGGAGVVGVVSSEGTDLERSAAFRAYRADHSEAQQYLERPKQP